MRQRGQALVETVVAMTLLVTLLATMPAMLAYHDIQRTAHRVARDASFMAGWRAPLDATARQSLAELDWRHPADGRAVIETQDSAPLSDSNGEPPGRAAAMLQFIAAPLREAGGYLGEAFALEQDGFRKVQVELQVPPLRGTPAPFDALALSLRGEAALLTGAWNASGPAQVAARSGGLVPTHLLQSAQAPMRAFTALLQVIEPAYADFCPGLIEPERVPDTRLQSAGARGLIPLRSRACR